MNSTNKSSFSDEELNRLLDELCDETIDQEGRVRLQSILTASLDARAQYLEHIDLHVNLRRLQLSSGDLPTGGAKFLELINTPSSFIRNEDRADDVVRDEVKQSIRWRRAAAAAFAATLLLAAGVSWLLVSKAQLESDVALLESKPMPGIPTLSSNANSQPLVQMINAASAKFFGEQTPEVNGSMRFGHEYALSRGMIELRFPAGATTIIEAPAIFKISTGSRLVLTTGVCSVHAPVGAQGFQVDTPVANVVDLGTRFVVDVSQSGESSVHVVEGEAELVAKGPKAGKRDSGQAKISLRQHQAQRLLHVGDRLAEEIPYDESSYKRDLPDRIIKFDAVEDENGSVDELLAVTVQRAGREYQYSVDEMVGIDLIHYRSASNSFMISPEISLSVNDDERRSRFTDRDRSLCSGLINPGGQVERLVSDPVLDDSAAPDNLGTPGIGFRFQSPVVNGDGPDVIVFEIQTIVNPESGDFFHVSPLKFSAGLHSHSVVHYDIDLVSPQSRFIAPYRLYRSTAVPLTLAQALTIPYDSSDVHAVRAKVLAVGIDLTDLGYPLGASVDGLFLQDALDDANSFDPVFIAGFPPTP